MGIMRSMGRNEGASAQLARPPGFSFVSLGLGPCFCKSFDECELGLIGPNWADYWPDRELWIEPRRKCLI